MGASRASSQAESIPSPGPVYRTAKPIPEALLDHSTICIEEQLFTQAFTLLSNALTSGTGCNDSLIPAQIPPPSHLGLAATLIVHPQLTTRTTAPDKHAAADDALRYLREVSRVVGARSAEFDKAFAFRSHALSSRSQRAARGKRAAGSSAGVSGEAVDSESEHTETVIRSAYVGKESLWGNTEDFWKVVGWAFNSSVMYPLRWERWKVWLEWMTDVLEDDLRSRIAEQSDSTDDVEGGVGDSLFAKFLSPVGEGRNNKRRLMRAILANGQQKSVSEFPEIWKHETRAPKARDDERMAKRRKLDLENNEFGDYFDNDSDPDSGRASARRSRSTTAAPSRQRSRAASEEARDDSNIDSDNGSEKTIGPHASHTPSEITTYGDTASIRLRQRLLALLTLFSAHSPTTFLDNEELFDLFTEFLRPLPLPIFQHFVLPIKPYLPPVAHANLIQMLLRPLLAAAAPPYSPEAPSQSVFEKAYARNAAGSVNVVDNAKVSLLVEGLMRVLWRSGGLVAREALSRRVKKGIKARRHKVGGADAKPKKSGASGKRDEEARVVLKCSGKRMEAILELV